MPLVGGRDEAFDGFLLVRRLRLELAVLERSIEARGVPQTDHDWTGLGWLDWTDLGWGGVRSWGADSQMGGTRSSGGGSGSNNGRRSISYLL